MCRSAAPLHEFLPVTDMFAAAEAIVRVFHKLGDYKHKHKNRMKFLIKSLGLGGLQERVRERAGRSVGRRRAAAAVRSRGTAGRRGPRLGAARRRRRPSRWRCASRHRPRRGPAFTRSRRPVLEVADADFLEWQRRNLRPQKQAGYVAATVTLPLGDITSEQLRVLAEPGQRLRRRHAAPDNRSGPHRAVGADRRARAVLRAAGRRRPAAWPKRACPPTSQAVRGPSRVGLR